MATPPKATTRATAATAVQRKVGLVFYKPAVRDAVSRSDLVEMKALLKTAKDLQKTDLNKVVADLEAAIAKVGK